MHKGHITGRKKKFQQEKNKIEDVPKIHFKKIP